MVVSMMKLQYHVVTVETSWYLYSLFLNYQRICSFEFTELLASTTCYRLNKFAYTTNNNHAKYSTIIATANNSNYQTIPIPHLQEQIIFFQTVSLVFDITIQINYIESQFHHSTTINTCNNINSIKIINQCTSISGTSIFEP
jgi:hypothetical protein